MGFVVGTTMGVVVKVGLVVGAGTVGAVVGCVGTVVTVGSSVVLGFVGAVVGITGTVVEVPGTITVSLGITGDVVVA